MKQTLRILLQIAAGILPLVCFAYFTTAWSRAKRERSIPEGWTIIRPPGEVSCLLPEGPVIWAGGRNGLFKIATDSCDRIPLPAGAPDFDYVRAIYRASNGTLWIGHDAGLVSLTPEGKWQQHNTPFRRALALARHPAGKLLAGTEAGLFALEGGNWTREDSGPEPDKIGDLDTLYVDRTERLWVASSDPVRGGLRVRDAAGWRAIGAQEGLPHPSVNSIWEDASGVIWIGTGFSTRGGAVRWTANGRLEPVPLDPPWHGIKIRSFYQDASLRIWAGLEYDGALILDGGKHSHVSPAWLAGQEVKVVRTDARGAFWLGTNGGLSRYLPNSL